MKSWNRSDEALLVLLFLLFTSLRDESELKKIKRSQFLSLSIFVVLILFKIKIHCRYVVKKIRLAKQTERCKLAAIQEVKILTSFFYL